MARPTRVCHWTQAVHAAVHQLLVDAAALRTDEGKPWGIARLAAELLREIDAREAARAPEANE
jgi:hypothetical protein